MSAARTTFCERLGAIRRAVTDFRLQDLPLIPANSSHNASVRIIRNGLAVQCFNILEDFVKARTAEALADVSASTVLFHFLPDGLQRATTIEAIRAIDFQLRFRDKADRIRYAQQYSAMVATTTAMPLRLADIAFFHASSNISKESYRDALQAFSVKDPWTQVSGLSSRLRLSGLPAENVFTSFAQRRHDAAHNAGAVVSESDLTQSFTDATGLAIGFDVLLSKATRVIGALTAKQAANSWAINDHLGIPLRFIKAKRKGFAEIKEGGARSTRTSPEAEALVTAALGRARKENGALVVYNPGGDVTKWLL